MIESIKPPTKFNEDTLVSLGLNIKLNDQLFLSDILRIEFDCEVRNELIKYYLNSILPSEILVLDQEPQIENIDFICIFQDFSALVSIKQLKISINRLKENYISFFHNRPKSYSLISISKFVVRINKNEDLQAYLEDSVSTLSLIKLKAELIGFLYKNSDINARALMKKCNEAKSLFTSDSRQNSFESFNNSLKSFKRSLSDDSWNFSEDKESLYDLSISDDYKESYSEFIELDDKEGVNNESLIESYECVESHTPVVSFKAFDLPVEQLKFLLKLQELNLDSTRPLSCEYDNYSPEMVKFIKINSSSKVKCQQCIDCVIG